MPRLSNATSEDERATGEPAKDAPPASTSDERRQDERAPRPERSDTAGDGARRERLDERRMPVIDRML